MKAFPTTNWKNMAPLGTGYDEGMDLRDYFAAKAMQGLLANPKLQAQILNTGGAWGSWIPDSAYGWADAMMEARKEFDSHEVIAAALAKLNKTAEDNGENL